MRYHLELTEKEIRETRTVVQIDAETDPDLTQHERAALERVVAKIDAALARRRR